MPSSLTYPGVYVEEIPSGVRTITGVATSITAFVGSFPRGPRDSAVRVLSYGDFEREFGGLAATSEASYVIQQFFLNGGSSAFVVRVTNTDTGVGAVASAASMTLLNAAATTAFTVTAANEGAWGDQLRIEIDYHTPTPDVTFNMTVTEIMTVNGLEQPRSSESFRNLTMTESLADRIEGESALIRLSSVAFVSGDAAASAANRPLPTGTTSGDLLSIAALPTGTQDMDVTVTPAVGAANTYGIQVDMTDVTRPSQIAARLQAALRGVSQNAGDPVDLGRATVTVVGDAGSEQYLLVRAGTDGDRISFADTAGALAATVAFAVNVQRHQPTTAGADGALPGATDLVGSDVTPRTGIYSLRDVDLFNILSIPDTMRLGDAAAGAVFAAATVLAEQERAFYILDVPQNAANPRDTPAEIEDWIGDNGALRHRNVATYYPRPQIADALNGFLLRSISVSGTAAGLYARTDTARGVWKAPAGTDAALRGVAALEYRLTDAENGVLNPLAVNALRNLPVYGRVVWGARTLVGADALASEWKYVPVRRTALYIEESLFRGLQWVVFEPNDEPLWASIRLNVGAFMQGLFRQGAFQGSSPAQAYLVKCDAETTTQTDIDRGIVNIVVGFAPLKPAEFVVLKIQQLTAQSGS